MAAGWKVESLSNGNIALRIFSNKTGTVRLVNEMVFSAKMADKIAFALAEKAKAQELAHMAENADKEFENMKDEDFGFPSENDDDDA